MQLNTEKFRSPGFIFAAYTAAASLLILGFRFIFPGEPAPLPIFSRNWRLIRGILDIIALFPALAFSALVIPFGIPSEETGAQTKFSQRLFQRMIPPVITAICAAAVYAALFFLALPLAQNRGETMRFQGEMYRIAKDRAHNHAAAGEWIEASHFAGFCDSVWENSPELAPLKTTINIHLDEMGFAGRPAQRTGIASVSSLPGQREPVDAADAIAMGEAALAGGRLLDAHWLALLGERIAREGSPEAAAASRLAARAWNQIESQQPGAGERMLFSLYQLKMSGYQAMVSGDWIRAYYIFLELADMSPGDPDVEKFLAASEKGIREIAFFVDEMQVSQGETLTGVVLSLPSAGSFTRGSGQGRSVVRISSLSANPDFAYGIGVEYMAFDSGAKLLASMEAAYAKILPITIDGHPKVLILMRVLDRADYTKGWEPRWIVPENAAGAQITLDISYATFLELSQMRQGLPGMQINELFAVKELARETGHIPQVYEAEILNRLGACLFFLPAAVLVLVIGWYFRARQRARYLFVLSLPVLPLVFNCLVWLYRTGLNIIGTSLILALGFSTALALFVVMLIVSFIVSLILLAAQHG